MEFFEQLDPNDLPGDRVDRDGNDEVAAQAFTAACTAAGGPGAGVLCDWYTHGGAEWIQGAILSALPSQWRAQGVFDWVSYVIEPIRRAAIVAFQAQLDSTDDIYRRMLDRQGLTSPGQWTPEILQWSHVRTRIKGTTGKTFREWVYWVAVTHHGLNAPADSFDGVKGFAKLRSKADCEQIVGKIGIESLFCTRLDGISQTPRETDITRMGATLKSLYTWARLQPLQRAISQCLDAAQVAATDQAQSRGMLWKKASRFTPDDPRRLALPVTIGTAAVVACGIVVGWYVVNRK